MCLIAMLRMRPDASDDFLEYPIVQILIVPQRLHQIPAFRPDSKDKLPYPKLPRLDDVREKFSLALD